MDNGVGEVSEAWRIVSSIMGWVYFCAWSLSFYPQLILNYRRKSVQGLSMDFIYYNFLGFLCYSIYNLSFFFSKEIQDEYKRRNHGSENLVRANDVVFAVHAFAITALTLLQTFIYKKDDAQRLSRVGRTFISMAGIGALIVIILAGTGVAMWIDFMYYLSYVKLVISIIKYVPQAWLNYRRKSTVGWSIHNILLDFTGGVLSIAQLLLDAHLSGDWSGVSGNPVKFGLGFIAIAFDLLFITQHYILYRDRVDFYLNTPEEECRRLLAEGGVPRDEDEEFV